MLQYNSFSDVPRRGFERKRDQAARSWIIPAGSVREGEVWEKVVRTKTDRTRVFRAVEKDQ